MRNYYKFLAILLLSCSVSLWSCKDDADGDTDDTVNVPEKDPVVEISQPALSADVRGTITINAVAKVAADVTVDKMTVLVDNEPVSEVAGAAVSFDWNSATVKDGPHTIKITATTTSGRAGAASVVVNVNNMPILAEFAIPLDYQSSRGNNVESWFFASDEQGNTIDVVRAERGKTCTLYRKNDFAGEFFTVTGVVRSLVNLNGNDHTNIQFYTVTGFNPGKYTGQSQQSSIPTSVGKAKASFVDVPAISTGNYKFLSPATNLEPDYTTLDQIYTGDLYKNPVAYMFLYSSENNPQYFTGKLVPGDDITRSVADNLKGMEVEYVTIPKGEVASVIMSGNREDGFYYSYIYYRSALDASRKKPMHYPFPFFDSFTVSLRADEGHTWYKQTVAKTKTLPTTMEYIDCSVGALEITDDNRVMLNVQGTCDFATFLNYETFGNMQQSWNVWTTPNVEFVMPKVPDAIRKAYPSVVEYNKISRNSNSIEVFDYETFDGYDDFVKTPYGFMDIFYYPSNESNKSLYRWTGQ